MYVGKYKAMKIINRKITKLPQNPLLLLSRQVKCDGLADKNVFDFLANQIIAVANWPAAIVGAIEVLFPSFVLNIRVAHRGK